MKKFPNEKRSLETKKFYYNFNGEIYEKRKVFYSTFKNELKVQINPGNLIFVLYVVEDLFFDKNKNEFKDKEINSEDTEEDNTYDIGDIEEESPENIINDDDNDESKNSES